MSLLDISKDLSLIFKPMSRIGSKDQNPSVKSLRRKIVLIYFFNDQQKRSLLIDKNAKLFQ